MGVTSVLECPNSKASPSSYLHTIKEDEKEAVSRKTKNVGEMVSLHKTQMLPVNGDAFRSIEGRKRSPDKELVRNALIGFH